MGVKERMGAEKWSAGGNSSLWDTLLVHRDEKGEFVAWAT